MTPATEVLDVALQLSKAERAKVAEALLESLEDDGQGESLDAEILHSEIEARLEAFRTGETTAEDWRVVIERVKSQLQSRRP